MGTKNSPSSPKIVGVSRRQSRSQPGPLHIVLLGESYVGKTCLARTYDTGVFRENTCLRIGVSRHIRKLKVQNITAELFIWNVIGQERYRELWPSYIRLADGALLLYDVANARSFRKISQWAETVRKNNKETTMFIIGARSDLVDEREVSGEEGQKFARSEKLEFFECSAKTGENVNEIFELIALRILQKRGLIPFDDEPRKEGKSLEWKETNGALDTPAIEEEMLHACSTVADALKLNQQHTGPSEEDNSPAGNGGKKNDNTSSESNNKEPADKSCQFSDDKKIEKLESEEEEMLLEGKCPAWFT